MKKVSQQVASISRSVQYTSTYNVHNIILATI